MAPVPDVADHAGFPTRFDEPVGRARALPDQQVVGFRNSPDVDAVGPLGRHGGGGLDGPGGDLDADRRH